MTIPSGRVKQLNVQGEARVEPHDRTTFEGVQALRFFAAGLVIVAHAMVVTQERLDAHLPLWQGGLDGVDVFFAISGFIIYLTSKGQSARDFVLHRLFRIIPLYRIVSAVKVSFLHLAPGVALHHSFDLVYVIKSFLFIPAATSEGLIVPVHTVGCNSRCFSMGSSRSPWPCGPIHCGSSHPCSSPSR